MAYGEDIISQLAKGNPIQLMSKKCHIDIRIRLIISQHVTYHVHVQFGDRTQYTYRLC